MLTLKDTQDLTPQILPLADAFEPLYGELLTKFDSQYEKLWAHLDGGAPDDGVLMRIYLANNHTFSDAYFAGFVGGLMATANPLGALATTKEQGVMQ